MNLQTPPTVGLAPASPGWQRFVNGFSKNAVGHGDQRLDRVPEGLGTAGDAAEDECALEDRHDEIGQDHSALRGQRPTVTGLARRLGVGKCGNCYHLSSATLS
jgi:hypothetical protein